jgi:hypothetical protein
MTRPKKTTTAPVQSWAASVIVGEEDMEEVKDVTIREAKTGNMHAAAIVERIWRRRRRTVTLDLPPVNDAAGLATAQAEVIAAAARGTITAREGIAWAALLDYRRRALDTVEYETRLVEIEKANTERARREAENRR